MTITSAEMAKEIIKDGGQKFSQQKIDLANQYLAGMRDAKVLAKH